MFAPSKPCSDAEPGRLARLVEAEQIRSPLVERVFIVLLLSGEADGQPRNHLKLVSSLPLEQLMGSGDVI